MEDLYVSLLKSCIVVVDNYLIVFWSWVEESVVSVLVYFRGFEIVIVFCFLVFLYEILVVLFLDLGVDGNLCDLWVFNFDNWNN